MTAGKVHDSSARRCRNDRGSVLPLVLVFVVVMGAVVAALAGYAAANLRFASVTEGRAYRLSAADAALRNATDQLRAGVAECLFTGQPVELPAVGAEFNGVDASVQCDSVAGVIDAPQLWAVVITGETVDPAHHLVKTAGGSGNKVIEGLTWLSRLDKTSGGVSVETGPSHALEIRNSSLVYYDDTTDPECTSVPASDPTGPIDLTGEVEFSPALIYRPVCTKTPWTNQPSFDDPPISSDLMLSNVNPPPDVTTYPGCVVYEPGTYIDASLPSAMGDDVYFQTGDYLFYSSSASVAQVDFQNADARAGSIDPALATIPEIDMTGSRCADAIDDDGPDAGGRYGVTFYLSGEAQILIDNNASLEIMPRLQSGQDRTANGVATRDLYVSIQSICDPTVFVPDSDGDSWCDTTDQSGAPIVAPITTFAGGVVPPSTLPGYVPRSAGPGLEIIYTAAGANKELVTHGHVYVPTGQVRFDNAAAPATDVRILGGLTVARIDIQVEPSATNFRLGTDTHPVDVEIVLTAAATLDGGTTRMQSVVDYRPNEDRVGDRVDIESWRVCAGAC